MAIRKLAISKIVRDPKIQARCQLNQEAVDALTDAYKSPDPDNPIPPPVVFTQKADRFWLGDGWHRVAGAEAAGEKEIDVDQRFCDNPEEEAFIWNCTHNRFHGVRMTNEDKRRAVMLAIERWPKDTHADIASRIGVTAQFVGKARKASVETPKNETVSFSNSSDSNSDDDGESHEADHEHDFDGIDTDDSAETETVAARPEEAGGKIVGADKRRKKLKELRIAFGNTIQIADQIKAGADDQMFLEFREIVTRGDLHIRKWERAIK